jgi:5'-methylthioadenosine phosphorylase
VTKQTFLGVIGGSGLYELPGIQNVQEILVETPFGVPSDKIITGEVNGKRVAFLPRHGKGHRFLPSEVNYRANVYALKKLGVTHILSVSAVGSLQEQFAPGTIVIPSQILDRTASQRSRSFFGNGVVGHVGFSEPFCPDFQKIIKGACDKEGNKAHLGGTYVCVEGPRFSTKAESHSFRALDAAIIGMTAMPEAILAREAEMPYATLAFVTDYDCWREGEEAVTVEAVLAVLKKNVDASKRIVKNVLEGMPVESNNPIFEAAKFAIMTSPQLIPFETKRNLELLYGKYWG